MKSCIYYCLLSSFFTKTLWVCWYFLSNIYYQEEGRNFTSHFISLFFFAKVSDVLKTCSCLYCLRHLSNITCLLWKLAICSLPIVCLLYSVQFNYYKISRSKTIHLSCWVTPIGGLNYNMTYLTLETIPVIIHLRLNFNEVSQMKKKW